MIADRRTPEDCVLDRCLPTRMLVVYLLVLSFACLLVCLFAHLSLCLFVAFALLASSANCI